MPWAFGPARRWSKHPWHPWRSHSGWPPEATPSPATATGAMGLVCVCVCVCVHTRQDLYRFERFELISVEFKLQRIDNSFQNLDRLLWEIITDPLKFQENHQFQTKSNASDLPMEQCVSGSKWFDKSTIRIWLPEANCQQRALCDMQLQHTATANVSGQQVEHQDLKH